MEKNPKKNLSKAQLNSLLLIIGIISPYLLYIGLTGEIAWLTYLASALIVGTMLTVIVLK
jgi:hypothetical protein